MGANWPGQVREEFLRQTDEQPLCLEHGGCAGGGDSVGIWLHQRPQEPIKDPQYGPDRGLGCMANE